MGRTGIADRPLLFQRKTRPSTIEIEIMLQMYLLQCWFNQLDERVENTIYDGYTMRKFMGSNFFEQDIPDITTFLHFQHLLEQHGIGKLLFDTTTAVWSGLCPAARSNPELAPSPSGCSKLDRSWNGDNQNIPNPRQHQGRQGAINHGLVIDG